MSPHHLCFPPKNSAPFACSALNINCPVSNNTSVCSVCSVVDIFSLRSLRSPRLIVFAMTSMKTLCTLWFKLFSALFACSAVNCFYPALIRSFVLYTNETNSSLSATDYHPRMTGNWSLITDYWQLPTAPIRFFRSSRIK